jgi:hypothetical protein
MLADGDITKRVEKGAGVEFIFMLTRDDRTVEDCVAVLGEVLPLGLRHVGFKDVGVDRATLVAANDAIKVAGATSYLEVVGTELDACARAAMVARDIGVDRLLGGTNATVALDILDGSGIGYYPFPGRPSGHPTVLGGTAGEVSEQCRAFEAAGCAGVDLLAYRATEDDPIALVRAAREAVEGEVIVAGSVDSPARIRAVAAAGADAFTIGSAAFNGSFAPGRNSLAGQVNAIVEACRELEPAS